MMGLGEGPGAAIARDRDPLALANKRVHELVSAQAARRPSALAVAAPDATLSFAQLECRSNQLARRLGEIGVLAEMPVGLCLPRSAALVVGALAILKAGGAYVALDPGHPRARLHAMLGDAGACAVVCDPVLDRQLRDALPDVVALDSDWAALDGQSAEPLSPSRGDLAYVIYTSGSTGAPKGVMLEHCGLLNLVRWHQHAFGVSELDRTTQIASPGFDASVWELWPSLCAGASVHVPTEELRTAPEALRDWLVAQRISVSFLPTQLAEAVVDLEWPVGTALRWLLTGGDVLRRAPARRLPFTVVNNYGPAEATVVATSGTVPHGAGSTSPPSIGRPIDNVHVHIVDDHLLPVPVGEAGELLIGGAGVGRGYVNQPLLTAEKFLPDNFSGVPGSRLYRSGDRARILPSGEIEFIGRIDTQVNIRGRRIELGEIEATLGRHPDVHTSAVVAEEHVSGDARLVAFVVPINGRPLISEALRAHLAESLPDHMLPAIYMSMKELPVGESGKVDRAALLAAVARPSERPAAFRGPSDAVEAALAATVAQLLELDVVGVDENFFMLGGHSLLGAQLIARIGARYGVEMPLRTLFEHPSVGEMAIEVERLLTAGIDAMSEEEAERLASELGRGAA